MENPNTIDIKSVTMERPKTFHNLCKTIRQTKKILQVGSTSKNSTSPLCSETTKPENLFDETKTMKGTNNETISRL